MWILIATVCSSLSIKDCIPMVWPVPFANEAECAASIPIAEATGLPADAKYIFSRCAANPAAPNT